MYSKSCSNVYNVRDERLPWIYHGRVGNKRYFKYTLPGRVIDCQIKMFVVGYEQLIVLA